MYCGQTQRKARARAFLVPLAVVIGQLPAVGLDSSPRIRFFHSHEDGIRVATD